MKIEKNKIVFGSVIAVIVLFLISYSLLIMDEEETENFPLKNTLVPELEQENKQYDSKLDAINDLKVVRETNAPSIYDEKLIDSLGFFDPELTEKEKERIVDSIYESGGITYSKEFNEEPELEEELISPTLKRDVDEIEEEQKIQTKEMGLEHQLFFASYSSQNPTSSKAETDSVISVLIDGNQVVMANSRLRMRVAETAKINGQVIKKNTLVYGFISFKPNRALVEVENINHHPVNLKAYDLQDGSEGIYVENSFRAEATSEVLDDIIQDINIPSVPQISGITKVLRRNNRNVKVTILNDYKLILKEKP
ncbi:conjugative transposon protein TraM [Antarcticibacterium flavum]|uniref:Conjugative transposon protein TraM n=1 Tax=Antarcticibacterium flavum TaxID=2058175 RepID=A0A5B7X3S9_9FLAO|nr:MULTISPECIES: conjugative transposon protein TraM [Antarcticibacterium]MCM4158448.1 conjugal transfer protein TraM [Antarcticibacterium sp. W02-3]QCY70204.1 conjugative transposon protein TraM [Antarcticibacterium flavum]